MLSLISHNQTYLTTERVSSKLDEDQGIALLGLIEMDTIVFILGHLGSGKLYSAGMLAQMLVAADKKTLVVCPSNAAVDTLATRSKRLLLN